MGFIIYALLFRLFVITAGVVAIVLGYKLFVQGVIDKDKSCVTAQACSVGLTLYNAAPGSVFALFGAFIIIVMLIQGNPELLVEGMEGMEMPSYQSSGGRIQMKGGQGDKNSSTNNTSELHRSFQQAINRGKQLQQFRDSEGAEKQYFQALSLSEVSLYQAANVFNELAWMYREQGRIDEAIVLARLATIFDGNNPAYFDTLALILLDMGDLQAAKEAADAAVALDPNNKDHINTLNQVRSALEMK